MTSIGALMASSGLNKSAVLENELRKFTAWVSDQAKKRGLPYVRVLGQQINGRNRVTNIWGHLKDYYESKNLDYRLVNRDLKARFPYEWKTGKVNQSALIKPRPEPEPVQSSPEPVQKQPVQNQPVQTSVPDAPVQNNTGTDPGGNNNQMVLIGGALLALYIGKKYIF